MEPTPQQPNQTSGSPFNDSLPPASPEQPLEQPALSPPRYVQPAPTTPVTEAPAPPQASENIVPTPQPAQPQPMVIGMQTPYQPLVPSTGQGTVAQVGDFSATATNGPVAVAFSADVPGGTEPKKSRKKLWQLSGGAALVLLLAAGAVFGLYLPNTPSNVYNTGINRSGKALDSLVGSATDQKKLESYKASTITGSLQAKLGSDGEYDGDFSTSFDKANVSGGLNITLKNSEFNNKTISAKVISKLPSGSMYPNVYFQVSGYKDLGLDSLVPGISAYDGSWIKIDSSYLQSLGQQVLGGSDNTKSQVTASDITELAKAAAGVTRQYVFTTDSDKNVLVKQSYEGKEKMDGLTAYHYKVSVNVDHAKAYCTALGNAVMDTNAYKKLSGQSAGEIADAKKDSAKSCASDVSDSIKSSDRFDMWIGGKYKLIHKVRFYDKTDKQSYTDVGQNYTGGDDVTFFTDIHDASGKTDGHATLTLNSKTSTVASTFKVTGSGDDSYTITGSVKAVASDKAVNVTEPATSVPLQDVLSKFGIDPAAYTSSGVQSKAQDTKRQTDIYALDAQLETVYALNGSYPNLADVNNAAWRKTNMSGLDPAALQPPNSTASTLATTATQNQYGYAPTECVSDGCQGFTLSALLSDNTMFTKTSLGP